MKMIFFYLIIVIYILLRQVLYNILIDLFKSILILLISLFDNIIINTKTLLL